jgi:hypothetical protein
MSVRAAGSSSVTPSMGAEVRLACSASTSSSPASSTSTVERSTGRMRISPGAAAGKTPR